MGACTDGNRCFIFCMNVLASPAAPKISGRLCNTEVEGDSVGSQTSLARWYMSSKREFRLRHRLVESPAGVLMRQVRNCCLSIL